MVNILWRTCCCCLLLIDIQQWSTLSQPAVSNHQHTVNKSPYEFVWKYGAHFIHWLVVIFPIQLLVIWGYLPFSDKAILTAPQTRSHRRHMLTVASWMSSQTSVSVWPGLVAVALPAVSVGCFMTVMTFHDFLCTQKPLDSQVLTFGFRKFHLLFLDSLENGNARDGFNSWGCKTWRSNIDSLQVACVKGPVLLIRAFVWWNVWWNVLVGGELLIVLVIFPKMDWMDWLHPHFSCFKSSICGARPMDATVSTVLKLSFLPGRLRNGKTWGVKCIKSKVSENWRAQKKGVFMNTKVRFKEEIQGFYQHVWYALM